MKPEKCHFCKSNLSNGITEFMTRLGDRVIVITDVPAWKCENCGEAYYSPETSRKIDVAMKKAHSGEFIAKPLAAGKIKLSEIQ